MGRPGRAHPGCCETVSGYAPGEDKPADNAERMAFAEIAYDRKSFTTAARLWAEILAADPKLGDDLRAGHRYNAACAAALAAAGQGIDEPEPDEATRTMLRRQTLEWLQEELLAWSRQIEKVRPQDRQVFTRPLAAGRVTRTWQASVMPWPWPTARRTNRGGGADFWTAVDSLLKNAQGDRS